VRADARAALDGIVSRIRDGGSGAGAPEEAPVQPTTPLEVGSRVSVGGLGLEGVIVEIHGKQAEVDVRGKRLRAGLRDLRAAAGGAASGAPGNVSVSVDLRPREGSLSELNVIGCTVDEALTRLDKFIDDSTVTGQSELRIVHGHGTGQLRRAIADFLKDHPLVARISTAPANQGGGGATIVELKD
jgi:DNA mismatch repair protein MutS2